MHTAIQLWGMTGPQEAHLFHAKVKEDFHSEMMSLSYEFHKFIKCHVIREMVIEATELRTANEVSMAAGARGNLSKLSYITGMYMAIAGMQGIYVHPPVHYYEWAGQLSYSQLRNILKIKFQYETKTEHSLAAYGIGLWAQGEL